MKYTGPLEKRPIIDPSDAPDGNLRLELIPSCTKTQLTIIDTGST
jgi:hypothetical protein